ncbi:MAG: DUF928 domain-containing protein, partial [Cyanobacteria bacterium P01_F01_bin.42]
MNTQLSQTLIGIVLMGSAVCMTDVSMAVEFKPPNDSAPKTSVGGGVRGNVQFALPQGGTPQSSVGGGTRGDVQFAVPGQSNAPKNSVGGGTRGDVQFGLPGQSSAPKTSVGGGTRGVDLPLTAILPPTELGRTVSGRPTVFAYLPPMGTTDGFFSLQDESGQSHYHSLIKVPESGGVLSVTLPESAPEIEIGKNYLWYFAPIESG